MAQTIWQRYFQDQYDAAFIDVEMRMARPIWITCSIDPHCRAGYALEWPYRCPHCGRSLIIEGDDPFEQDVVLVIAEERLPALPCPYCKKDIPTQRATQDTIEQWEAWQFLKIWVAVKKVEQLQVQEWNA